MASVTADQTRAPRLTPGLAGDLRAQGLPAALIGEVIPGTSGRVDVPPGPFGSRGLPRIR